MELEFKYQIAIAELLFPGHKHISNEPNIIQSSNSIFSFKLDFNEMRLITSTKEYSLVEILKKQILTSANIHAWNYRGWVPIHNHSDLTMVRNSSTERTKVISECACYLRMARNEGFNEVKVRDQWLPINLYGDWRGYDMDHRY